MRKKINFKHSRKNYARKLNQKDDFKIHSSSENQLQSQDLDKQEIKPNIKQKFLFNFINAFNFGFVYKKKMKQNDVKDYFNIVINDFNASFEKIKNNYDRKRN